MIGSSIAGSTEDGLDKLAKHARAVLVLLAAVQLIGGAILYIAGALVDAAPIATTLGLGVIFGVLAIWARKDPLTAVLVGLGIWVAVHGIGAIIEPATLFSGLVVKAIVIVMFVNGISTGLTYNKMKHTLAGKP
ncbi:MAG TPA: hypothetical protein VK034_32085 [Enhygromyxa sp.]|nr:hypothetical protein [Enhygromyxa sp.]